MNKLSLTSALLLAVTVATAAGAQSTNRPDWPRRDQAAGQQDSTFRRGPRGPEGMLLRGITLSADQQKQLADLRDRERKEWEANRPRRQDGQAGPGAQGERRQRPDSATMAKRRAEMEQRFEQRIAAVRQILTSEQRVQFDKNVAELKAHRQQDGGRFGGRGPQRGGFNGQRGR